MSSRRNSIIVAISLIIIYGSAACFSFYKPNLETMSANSQIDVTLTLPAEQLSRAFSEISRYVSPAVVSVFSEKVIKYYQQDYPYPFGEDLFRQFFNRELPNQRQQYQLREYKIPQMGMGAGMLLDNEGHILTNYHLVKDVDDIKVQFANKKSYKAKVIGKDAKTDVAIIKIEGKGFEQNKTIEFGNSEAVRVGDVVLAIGAPFGLVQTVTHGIISAVGRTYVGLVDYEDFLQTDAPINPGNSGGPLVNIHGEVIGMNSAIATNVGQSGGVGFSIPSNMIKSMLPKLIKGENITRGELGVVIQNLNEDLARHFNLNDTNGVLVSQVVPDSTAEKSGLRAGDILLKFNDNFIDNIHSFRNRVAASQPDSKATLELIRDKKNIKIEVTIQHQNTDMSDFQNREKNEKNKNEYNKLYRLGLSIETLTKEQRSYYRVKTKNGALIVDLSQGSPAWLAGLQVGDVVIQCNHNQVKNSEDLIDILNKESSDSFLFLIDRMGSDIYTSIKMN